MAGGRHHRVVDGDDAERGERLAARLDQVEFGDLFFERAAGERHAEDRLAETFGGRFFLEALGAGILVLLVAPDAVVRLIERADQIGTGIGEREAFAMAQILEAMLREAARGFRSHGNQAHEV